MKLQLLLDPVCSYREALYGSVSVMDSHVMVTHSPCHQGAWCHYGLKTGCSSDLLL